MSPNISRFQALLIGSALIGASATPLLVSSAVMASGSVARMHRAEILAGQDDLESLIEALVTGQVAGDPPIQLEAEERAMLARELAATERGPLLSRLIRIAEEEESAEWRAAALEVLALMAGPQEFDLAFQLTGTEPVPPPTIRNNLLAVLVRLHGANPAVALSLRGPLLSASEVIQDVCLRALAVQPSREALELFSSCLGAGSSALDIALLARLGESWEKHPMWVEAAAVDRARALSESSDEGVARGSISALGHARDTRDAELWISLLDGESSSQARTAHWALRQVTGLQLGMRPEPWRTWLAASRDWQRDRKATALADLRGDNRTLVMGAMHEIADQKLDRRELAEAVANLLSTDDSMVARTAVSTLCALGTQAAVEPLLGVLESGDEDWRTACHQALNHLTGLDSEPTAQAWAEALKLEQFRP